MAPDVDPEAAEPSTLRWSLVIPVKVLAQAKSRLTGLSGQRRSELALAMAADTVAAAIRAEAVAAVVVVTDDPEVSDIVAGLGAVVLPDAPAAGLNAALGYGAEYSQERWPDRGRAGLAGDVPAARPQELTAALAAAARLGAAFVPDAEGTGTTLYAAVPGARFRPQFGPASRDRHLATGAVEIGEAELALTELALTALAPTAGARYPGDAGGATALAGLRRDVDTIDALRQAAEIGLGPHTLRVLGASAGRDPCSDDRQ